jgi:nitrite reductase/ring-hydroxylating ferredoxin subunit
MTSSAHDIGPVSGFESGRPYRVEIDGRPLVVVRKGDEFFALRDGCPHAGASLSDGIVRGTMSPCRPGDSADYVRDGEILSCPWHGWEFDLKSGCSLVKPAKIRVRSYPVLVKDGRVLVDGNV